MERIRHIAETQNKELLDAQTEPDETAAVREKIPLAPDYDPAFETDPEQKRVREYLKSFNEDLLKKLFLEYFRRSGSDEDRMNWIPFNTVRIVLRPKDADIDTWAEYDFDDNAITLYTDILQSPEQALHALIHEELHAITRTGSETAATGMWVSTVTRTERIGFATDTHDKTISLADALEKREPVTDVKSRTKEYIDEGATEFISYLILRAYMEQTGTLDNDYLFEMLISDDNFDNQLCLQLYVRLLAYVSEVPLPTTTNSVIRAFVRNGTLIPAELEALLSDQGDGILTKLKQVIEAGNSKGMAELSTDLYQRGLLEKDQMQEIADISAAAWEERLEYIDTHQ